MKLRPEWLEKLVLLVNLLEDKFFPVGGASTDYFFQRLLLNIAYANTKRKLRADPQIFGD